MGKELNSWIVALIRPPLIVIGFIVKPLYRLCFGWADKRAAAKNESRLRSDISQQLAFLFKDWNAEVVPNEGVPFPLHFDYAVVTLALENIYMRFIRGRGDLDVKIAARTSPAEWHDLSLVVNALNTEDYLRRTPIYDFIDIRMILKTNLKRIQDAFCSSYYPELEQRLSPFYAYERVAMKQLETEINRNL